VRQPDSDHDPDPDSDSDQIFNRAPALARHADAHHADAHADSDFRHADWHTPDTGDVTLAAADHLEVRSRKARHRSRARGRKP
jgi:hypothetical protein